MPAWLARTLLFCLVMLVLGHLLAVWGVWRGTPPPLWGDEQRRALQVLQAALEVVWSPWRALSDDAAAPAGWARFVIPLVAGWAAGEALVQLLAHRIRRAFMLRSGGHAVLFGMGPVGEALASEWVRAGRSVLVVSARDEHRFAAERSRAVFLRGDALDAATRSRVALPQAGFIACIDADDLRNVDAAMAVLDELGQGAGERPPVQLFVGLTDPYLRATLALRLRPAPRGQAVELHVFSSPQIGVRKLLRDHPMETFRNGAAAPCLWIFGAGPVGEELVLGVLRLGCWRHGAPPSVTVIDRDAATLAAAFRDRWGPDGAAARVHFEQAGAEQGERLFDRLIARSGAPTAIYFCSTDDAVNLANATALCAAFEAEHRMVPPLHLLQQSVTALRAVLPAQPWLVQFGSAAEVATELLYGERLDAMARAIHERYVSDALKAGEPLGARRSLQHWPELAQDLKDDNRCAADHHFVKLLDTGCGLAPASGDIPVLEWDAQEVEELARAEHDRWVVQRELAGWRHAPQRDDARKLHPDMVAWAELSEPRRELDRAVVRQVPALFTASDLQVRRERALRICAPRTPWAFTAGFETAVAALLPQVRAAAAPDLVRLWLEPDSALACRLAEQWLAAGCGRLGVLLREPAAHLLARVPTEELRPRVAALLAAADRVYLLPAGSAEPPLAPTQSRLLLSIDGSDLAPHAADWALDAEGRLLAQPTPGTE